MAIERCTLQHHLEFAEPIRAEFGRLCFEETTQPGDHQFASDYERHHPGGDPGSRHGQQKNKRAAHQHLVHQWIEVAAKSARQTLPSGDETRRANP